MVHGMHRIEEGGLAAEEGGVVEQAR